MRAYMIAGLGLLSGLAASCAEEAAAPHPSHPPQTATAPTVAATAPTLAEERSHLATLKAAEFAKHKATALNASQDGGQRALAVLRIAQLGSKDSAEFLANVWDRPLNVMHHEKLRLIDLCLEFGGPECVPMLLKAAGQDGADVRWHAAHALARIQGDKALPVLNKMAKEDADAIVRDTVQSYIKDLVAPRAGSVTDRSAILQAIVAWGRSDASGPYVKDEVVYLLRDDHPTNIETEALRLYSHTELELLGRMFDGYAVHNLVVTDDGHASAVFKYAVDPPVDPVPFPHAGWRLKLARSEGRWAVTVANRSFVNE